MSAWLERLRTLDSEKHACAEIFEIFETHSSASEKGNFEDNEDFGTGISPQNEVSGRVAWHKREDARLVVEDLFRERWQPYRIARHLGLTRAEVRTILRP
jgi:hypothetical protein